MRRALLVHFDHSRWIIYVIIGVRMCADDTILLRTTKRDIVFAAILYVVKQEFGCLRVQPNLDSLGRCAI